MLVAPLAAALGLAACASDDAETFGERILRVTSHQHCSGSATLAGGSPTLSRGGRVFGGTSTAVSIVGGSGTYAGATGSFTESEERDGRTPYTFRILVPER